MSSSGSDPLTPAGEYERQLAECLSYLEQHDELKRKWPLECHCRFLCQSEGVSYAVMFLEAYLAMRKQGLQPAFNEVTSEALREEHLASQQAWKAAGELESGITNAMLYEEQD